MAGRSGRVIQHRGGTGPRVLEVGPKRMEVSAAELFFHNHVRSAACLRNWSAAGRQ